MSREIKFSAWDKTNNEWFMEGQPFDLNFSGSYGDFFFDNDHPCNMRDVELEWLQFTGLHDKNGKEIYEGDIIEFLTNEGILRGIVAYCVELSAWFIEYNKNKGDILHCYIDGDGQCEVIGNVHDNPELLNGN